MSFTILFTHQAKKQYEKLIRKNPEIQIKIERLTNIIAKDPYNLSRRFDIKKLTDIKTGQWRIRSGNYRVRYDIDKNRVVIHAIFDRKKGY